MLLIIIILLTSCASPHKQDNDTLNQVTFQDLHNHALYLENRYQQYHQVDGIIWQAYRSNPNLIEPNRYGNGGDSCIFTGHKLAADVFRYRITKHADDLSKILQSLRGLYILTHITGKPGVICRAAFPKTRSVEWDYPSMWVGRDQRFVHTSPENIKDPFTENYFPSMIYYTRATRDQLTGVLFGLSVIWEYLIAQHADHQSHIDKARTISAQMVENIYNHLRKNRFTIVDENGLNDTSADDVDRLIYLQLLAIYRATVVTTSPNRVSRINRNYDKAFSKSFFNLADSVNIFSNYDGYFAWNLRHLRGYSIYILESNTKRRKFIQKWFKDRLWQYIADHLNAQFIFIQNAVNPKIGKIDDALLAMRSLKLKSIRNYDSPLADKTIKPNLLQVMLNRTGQYALLPHLRTPTDYTIWQKEPWDVGISGNNGKENSTGLDFILAYWMGRFYQLIPEN